MKKALLKDTIKEIKSTHRRFISILMMAFLGVGFFAGIRASSPDMVHTIDNYYKENNVYDIEVVSTLGLTNEDIEALKNVENVEQVYGTYSQDAIVKLNQVETVAKIMCNEDVNKPILVEGRLPENENECVVEPLLLTSNDLKIGDKLQIEIEDTTNDDGEEIPYLKQKEVEIVGTAKSPLYISRDKGTSKLGSGKINYYIYINKNNINATDIFTEIYIKAKVPQSMVTSTDSYEDYIEDIKTNIENIKDERESARYNALVDKATKKLNDAQNELNNQKQDAEAQINDAQNKINSSKDQLNNATSQLNSQKQQFQTSIAQAEAQLKTQKQSLQSISPQMAAQANKQLAQQEQALQTKKTQTTKQFQTAEAKLNSSKAQIAQAESELASKKQEFNDKIAEAESKLADAQRKIDEIEHPTWYILDRNSNQSYNSFIQDTQSVESVGVVFPIVFFVIATLISLTSMTRMVEEERTQIGTLKALGYTKMQIASKYLIYAFLACVIGGTIGMFVGCALLPRVIWMMYSMMYEVENFVAKFNVIYSTIGLAVTSVCIVGATLYEALRELVHTPAVLMRPKAPKNGKRVLLERIPLIWNKLNFTRKVTVRNLFRYKKRFLMTIIGISGCTALIITGFGMKDSISALLPSQFGKVFKYNMQIALKSDLQEDQRQKVINDLASRDEIKDVVETYVTAGDLSKSSSDTEKTEKASTEEVQIVVPKEAGDLEKVINLTDVKTNEHVELSQENDNQIALTDKVAQLIGVKKGDTVQLKDADDVIKTFQVTNIVENYVGHYVYMSAKTYETAFETSNIDSNVFYLVEEDITEEQEDKLAKEILDNSDISSVTSISTLVKTIDDMMSSLNYVVIVLIVSAGILAFVVLYNLSNVNISERIRELATIKVLGFYDKEVYNYISRETSILTLIGIVLGCIGGYFLNMFILGTCEINALRFEKIVNPISYVYSIAITILFTIIVSIVTYYTLKKIDMIESLKSVE